MALPESGPKQLNYSDVYFDPQEFVSRIYTAANFIKERLPEGFKPKVTLTLGSGGLGDIANLIEDAVTIPYSDIPGFKTTTVEGHKGNLVAGYLAGVPMTGLQGRIHYYEGGGQPNNVIALKNITFPVYVARALGSDIYFATNAAGGLNPNYKPGDLMIIDSHIDIHFPNPLLGPQVKFMDPMRFQPQDKEYNPLFKDMLHLAAEKVGENEHIHEGVYVALTGPTFETKADSQGL